MQSGVLPSLVAQVAKRRQKRKTKGLNKELHSSEIPISQTKSCFSLNLLYCNCNISQYKGHSISQIYICFSLYFSLILVEGAQNLRAASNPRPRQICNDMSNKFTKSKQFTENTSVLHADKSFTKWLHFIYTSKELTETPRQPQNDHTKMTQVRSKINFAVMSLPSYI